MKQPISQSAREYEYRKITDGGDTIITIPDEDAIDSEEEYWVSLDHNTASVYESARGKNKLNETRSINKRVTASALSKSSNRCVFPELSNTYSKTS